MVAITLSAVAKYYTFSSFIIVGPIGCAIYVLCQLYTQYWREDKTYRIQGGALLRLVFTVYGIGLVCGIIGFCLHGIPHSGEFCLLWGLPLCFVFYGGGKAVMYLMFVQKDKIASGEGAGYASKTKSILLNVVAPIYIAIYLIAYLVGTILFFPTQAVDAFDAAHDYQSFCVVRPTEGQIAFLVLASAVDLTNCCVFLYIFAHSIRKLVQGISTSEVMTPAVVEGNRCLLRTVKWNCGLAFVATFSSLIGLIIITAWPQKIPFLACLWDPLVNCSCCYFMMHSNRTFCHTLWCRRSCSCCCFPTANDKTSSFKGEAAASAQKNSELRVNGSKVTLEILELPTETALEVTSNAVAQSVSDAPTWTLQPQNHERRMLGVHII